MTEIYCEYTFNCWTQNVSSFTGSSIISVCFQITPAFAEYWSGTGFQTMCDITNHAHRDGLYHQIFNELGILDFSKRMWEQLRFVSLHIHHSQTFNNRNKRKNPGGVQFKLGVSLLILFICCSTKAPEDIYSMDAPLQKTTKSRIRPKCGGQSTTGIKVSWKNHLRENSGSMRPHIRGRIRCTDQHSLLDKQLLTDAAKAIQ